MTTPPGDPEPTGPTIYISGPITGIEDMNRPAFHIATTALRAKGYNAINPHEVTRHLLDRKWGDYMRADIVALMDCDGVATLPGHRKSKGAGIECRLARELGMKVRPLAMWLR